MDALNVASGQRNLKSALHTKADAPIETGQAKMTAGRGIITFIALLNIALPWIADLNSTHIYNPAWTGHAKFHVGHTMTLGSITGFLALFFLYFSRIGTELDRVFISCLIIASYWIGQGTAILVPHTTVADPGSPLYTSPVNQVHGDLLFVLLLTISYYIEKKRLSTGKIVKSQ